MGHAQRGCVGDYWLLYLYGGAIVTERKKCFSCKRVYFVDDPEFNAEKCICDNCAEDLESENPYTHYDRFGDLFTIDGFCELLEKGVITLFDGIGFYAIGKTESCKYADFKPAIVRKKAAKYGYTGVIWYNR